MSRNAALTEAEILDFLNRAGAPVTFYEMQKGLGYTPGRVQSALRRLSQAGRVVVKHAWDPNRRKQRVVVWTREFQTDPVPEGQLGSDQAAKLLEDVKAGRPFPHPGRKGRVVVPLVLSEFEARLLEALPAIDSRWRDLQSLVVDVLRKFVARLSNSKKVAAITHLVQKGVLSREQAAGVLGLTPEELEEVTGGE
ncbi:MAG: hypothetical protein Kow0069_04530 [Promethearchaeota archaeon]